MVVFAGIVATGVDATSQVSGATAVAAAVLVVTAAVAVVAACEQRLLPRDPCVVVITGIVPTGADATSHRRGCGEPGERCNHRGCGGRRGRLQTAVVVERPLCDCGCGGSLEMTLWLCGSAREPFHCTGSGGRVRQHIAYCFCCWTNHVLLIALLFPAPQTPQKTGL